MIISSLQWSALKSLLFLLHNHECSRLFSANPLLICSFSSLSYVNISLPTPSAHLNYQDPSYGCILQYCGMIFFANNSFFSRLSKMTMILLRRMKPDPIFLWCKARNWRSLILSCSRRSEKGRLAKCFKYICFHSFSPNFISFLGPPKGDWEDLCNEGDEQASHYRV